MIVFQQGDGLNTNLIISWFPLQGWEKYENKETLKGLSAEENEDHGIWSHHFINVSIIMFPKDELV